MYKIPILFVIFKRKDVALRTLESIKTVKPAKLYIAADGARDTVEGELEKVKQTRQAVLDAIDWECEVKTRLSEKTKDVPMVFIMPLIGFLTMKIEELS